MNPRRLLVDLERGFWEIDRRRSEGGGRRGGRVGIRLGCSLLLVVVVLRVVEW